MTVIEDNRTASPERAAVEWNGGGEMAARGGAIIHVVAGADMVDGNDAVDEHDGATPEEVGYGYGV